MKTGKVKRFSDMRGYGFITDEDGNDVFVHYSSIIMEGRKSLNENDIVEFEIGEGTTGRTQAVNVSVVYACFKNRCLDSQYAIERLKSGCVVIKVEFDEDGNIEDLTSYANDIKAKSSYISYVENRNQLVSSVIVERMTPTYVDGMWDIDTDLQSIMSFEEFEKEISSCKEDISYISKENTDLSDFGSSLELEFVKMLTNQ